MDYSALLRYSLLKIIPDINAHHAVADVAAINFLVIINVG
jgi:hypothetical protein